MNYELQTWDAPAGLEGLGQTVVLRELPYGQVRRVITGVGENGGGAGADALLAACLVVDGEPVGLDALEALPGRYAGALARATALALKLHGLGTEAAAPAAEDDTAGEP